MEDLISNCVTVTLYLLGIAFVKQLVDLIYNTEDENVANELTFERALYHRNKGFSINVFAETEKRNVEEYPVETWFEPFEKYPGKHYPSHAEKESGEPVAYESRSHKANEEEEPAEKVSLEVVALETRSHNRTVPSAEDPAENQSEEIIYASWPLEGCAVNENSSEAITTLEKWWSQNMHFVEDHFGRQEENNIMHHHQTHDLEYEFITQPNEATRQNIQPVLTFLAENALQELEDAINTISYS